MEWESPPSYTDDDRGSWNYPNYGLPKVLPLLLSTVVVLVTHAVRLAYYYKAQSNESNVLAEEIADLEGFLELSSDPNNDVFLGGLIRLVVMLRMTMKTAVLIWKDITSQVARLFSRMSLTPPTVMETILSPSRLLPSTEM